MSPYRENARAAGPVRSGAWLAALPFLALAAMAGAALLVDWSRVPEVVASVSGGLMVAVIWLRCLGDPYARTRAGFERQARVEAEIERIFEREGPPWG